MCIRDRSRCIKSENQEKDFYTNDEEYSSFKNMYSLILKFIFTCIIFISMPFVANKIANVGAFSYTHLMCIRDRNGILNNRILK